MASADYSRPALSFKRVAEAYAAAALQLVLDHADIEDAQDLVVSLHMMLVKYEDTLCYGPPSI